MELYDKLDSMPTKILIILKDIIECILKDRGAV